MYVDACYSGNVIDYVKSPKFNEQYFKDEVRNKLYKKTLDLRINTSCNVMENSAIDGKSGLSKFTDDRFNKIVDDKNVNDHYQSAHLGKASKFNNNFSDGPATQNPQEHWQQLKFLTNFDSDDYESEEDAN